MHTTAAAACFPTTRRAWTRYVSKGSDTLAHRQPRHPHAVASSCPPPASAAAAPRLALTTAEHQLSPTENLEAQAWSKAGTAARRAKARAKRYEGEMRSKCRELRAGAEWCDKCGGTTGTSAITVAVVVKTAIAAPGIVPPLQACPRCRAK